MASHLKDDLLHGRNHADTHATSSKWRHEESRSFAKHASLTAGPKTVRAEGEEPETGSSLADFLNQTRVEPKGEHAEGGKGHVPILLNGAAAQKNEFEQLQPQSAGSGGTATKAQDKDQIDGVPKVVDGREVRCGPLLNYRRMEGTKWFGSVLIVLRGGRIEGEEFVPELRLRKLGTRKPHGVDVNATKKAQLTNGDVTAEESGPSASAEGQSGNEVDDQLYGHLEGTEERVTGVKLYSDLRHIFWRFGISVEMEEFETNWEYEIPGLRFTSDGKRDKQNFFVPALNESMRIMFHSCNGFSVGTDEAAWSGPALWNDVQRVHKETPFHVMIGGGDQIYNDGIRVSGPLRTWTAIGNPKKRREHPFPEKLRKECDDFYVNNYVRWYSTEPFAGANGQIPQINIWDDHDIIDGFGSYVAEFMRCDVFRGIGGVAYKYYLLFQHHLPPPISSYTTDAPQTTKNEGNGPGADPAQLKDTYVLQGEPEDPSYIIGQNPGPYVEERSRSIYARLGARIAFFGLDARTERTRHQVNYPETYELVLNRVRKELSEAASTSRPIQHLIVLLGIPIAYPRLTWLENIFSSPLMGPIKFLNKRFGVAGGFINYFDGSVDLLDDLDDHYTARTHKKERHELMIRLQELAQEFSVRITILGGDVHLAALGRFYSNPSLHIPVLNDHRYMVNVISSAIVNKPPPQAIANLLARRNKLHHLNPDTDETLLKLFDKDPGKGAKTAKSNHVTMPSRNWARITENSPAYAGSTLPESQLDGAVVSNGNKTNGKLEIKDDQATGKDGHYPLGPGELNAGSTNRAATERHGTHGDGSLDISIRVEKDQHDASGSTQAYGLWVPVLKARKKEKEREVERLGEIKDKIGDKFGEGTGGVVEGVGDIVKGKIEGSDGGYGKK